MAKRPSIFDDLGDDFDEFLNKTESVLDISKSEPLSSETSEQKEDMADQWLKKSQESLEEFYDSVSSPSDQSASQKETEKKSAAEYEEDFNPEELDLKLNEAMKVVELTYTPELQASHGDINLTITRPDIDRQLLESTDDESEPFAHEKADVSGQVKVPELKQQAQPHIQHDEQFMSDLESIKSSLDDIESSLNLSMSEPTEPKPKKSVVKPSSRSKLPTTQSRPSTGKSTLSASSRPGSLTKLNPQPQKQVQPAKKEDQLKRELEFLQKLFEDEQKESKKYKAIVQGLQDEVKQLKQENAILNTELASIKSAPKVVSPQPNIQPEVDPKEFERVKVLSDEQERLIKGYQAENEKLLSQLKAGQQRLAEAKQDYETKINEVTRQLNKVPLPVEKLDGQTQTETERKKAEQKQAREAELETIGIQTDTVRVGSANKPVQTTMVATGDKLVQADLLPKEPQNTREIDAELVKQAKEYELKISNVQNHLKMQLSFVQSELEQAKVESQTFEESNKRFLKEVQVLKQQLATSETDLVQLRQSLSSQQLINKQLNSNNVQLQQQIAERKHAVELAEAATVTIKQQLHTAVNAFSQFKSKLTPLVDVSRIVTSDDDIVTLIAEKIQVVDATKQQLQLNQELINKVKQDNLQLNKKVALFEALSNNDTNALWTQISTRVDELEMKIDRKEEYLKMALRQQQLKPTREEFIDDSSLLNIDVEAQMELKRDADSERELYVRRYEPKYELSYASRGGTTKILQLYSEYHSRMIESSSYRLTNLFPTKIISTY